MKITDVYYEKIYKQTVKVTRKLFGTDVTGALALRYELKVNIENIIHKPVDKITREDIVKNNLSYHYAKYKTVCKVLEILETACTLKTFTIEEYENEC